MKISAVSTNFYSFKALKKQEPRKQISDNCVEVSEITKEFGVPICDWYNTRCFYTLGKTSKINKFSPKTIIDCGDKTTSDNIETLRQSFPNCMSKSAMVKKYSVSGTDLTKWADYGFLKPVVLRTIDDNAEYYSSIYDLSNPTNVRCLDRLLPKRSGINKKLIQTVCNDPIEISVKELEAYGIGPKRKIYDLIQTGKLQANYSSEDNEYYLAVNNEQNMKILQYMRDARTISSEKAYAQYGISEYDFLNQIYCGNIEPLEAVFYGDMGELLIDLSKGNNRTNFYKLVISSLVHFKLVHGIDSMHNILALEIVSKLYPELITKANELISENEGLLKTLKKKDEFEEHNTENRIHAIAIDNEDSIAETEENTFSKPSLPTKEEFDLIEEFDKQLFESIDINEFISAFKESAKYVKIYNQNKSTKDIDNPIAKNTILNYRLNFKPNLD